MLGFPSLLQRKRAGGSIKDDKVLYHDGSAEESVVYVGCCDQYRSRGISFQRVGVCSLVGTMNDGDRVIASMELGCMRHN